MKSLLAMAAIAALIAPVSQASAGDMHHSRYDARHHQQHSQRNMQMRNSPVSMRTRGPRWASPGQCFEDLGYGRYESCDQ